MNVCCSKPLSLWSYVTTGTVICLLQDFCRLILTSCSCDPRGCPDLLCVRCGMWHPPALSPIPLDCSRAPRPRLFQSTGFRRPTSRMELALVIDFICGNVCVSMLFSQIIPPSPSPTEAKSLLFTAVSPSLPCM